LVRGHTENDHVVARYNPDGALDVSFGQGGYVVVEGFTAGTEVSADEQGRVLIYGREQVARLNPNGELDASFGVGGYAQLPSGFRSGPAEIDASGKILLIGIVWDGFQIATTVVKLTQDGALDPSFADGGVWTVPADPDMPIRSLFLDAEGRFIAWGYQYAPDPTYLVAYIARYTADAVLDPTFGNGGIKPIDESIPWVAAPTTETVDGKLLLHWTEPTSDPSFQSVHLARLTADGELDMSFSADGLIMCPFVTTNYQVNVDSQGRPVVAFNPGNSYSRIDVARFNVDGSLDMSFGTGGFTTIDLEGTTEYLFSLSIRADDGVLLHGWTNPIGYVQPMLVMLTASGQLDAGFGDADLTHVYASGNLFVQDGDPDNGDTLQWSGSAEGVYGDFVLTQQGSWTYTLDATSTALQELQDGQTATEVFVATLTDSFGASVTREVVVTIVGSYDAPLAP
jgi:uncharacterized delta-60 repeat protein